MLTEEACKLDRAPDCAEVARDNREPTRSDCALALKVILEEVDSFLYGNIFLERDMSNIDLVSGAEEIGFAAYRHMLDCHQRPEHISPEAIARLTEAIKEALPNEKTREALNGLCSRLDWRRYFLTRGALALGLFLGARLAGAPETLIARLGKQFMEMRW